MNLQDNKYNKFFLIREMLETGEIVKHLNVADERGEMVGFYDH